MNTFLIILVILVVLCCIPGAFFLKKHLMILSAAKELGLIDRGLVKKEISEYGPGVWCCCLCNTRSRAGVLKESRRAVKWCYVCIRIYDGQGGGDDGPGRREGLPPDPSPEGEPAPPEVVKQTREVLERIGRNTTPK